MKKIISLVLVVVMLFAVTALCTYAADITPSNKTEDMNIAYTAGEYYEITIPPNITLGNLDEYVVAATGLKLENVSLLPNTKLKVTAQSANNFAVAMQGTNHKVPYTLRFGTDNKEVYTANDPVVLVDIGAGVPSATCPMAFKRTGNAAVSGHYTDTITFTAEVYSVNPNS